ncbi:MAG: tetratricopeptide repeat protein [Prevotella sp.]|nr:tetratricopeptide repeat protein [Candidatus Prevotella equi]
MYRIIVSILFLLSLTLGTSAQYKVDRLLLSGRVALHYEDYVLSIQYFNQAISQKPYLWEPWQLRAIAKYSLDDWQGAINDATKAIELNPYVTTLYDLRGISYIRQEQYTDAINDYTKAISLEPDNQNYWYNRAVCYMECKDYETAQVQLDTIIRRWQKYAMPYLMKAEVFMHQKDTASAETWIAKSLEIDRYNADAWRVNAFLALNKERYKDADSLFTEALRLKPKTAVCYANRANARLKLNNLRGAMSDYDTALELMPNDILSHYNRGLLRQQVGDDNRAIEDFDYVLSLEPNNVMALFNRATLLDRTGNLKAAIRDYSKVIDKFPNFWTGLQYRAACYRKLGMTANAEKDEFRVLKAQMDKHLGVQQRWSRSKLSAMRKLSDIDPDKYNHLVVNDEIEDEHYYKSEYRGKVQNRQISDKFLPYIALTLNSKRTGISTYAPFDRDVDAFIDDSRTMFKKYSLAIPALGVVGEAAGVSTFDTVDNLTEGIRSTSDTLEAERMVMLRSIAYSSAQNYMEAIKDVDMYMVSHPESVVALWQRAVCNAMMAEFDFDGSPKEVAMRNAGVKSDFRRLHAIAPDNALVYYCHATFLARVGEFAEAAELFTKSIALDKTLPHAYYNRALVYMHLNEGQKMKQDLSKAGELGIYQAYSLMKNADKTNSNK